MLFFFDTSTNNRIYQFSDLHPTEHPNEGLLLNDSGEIKFNFSLMVDSDDFDNNDNPFGRFILHMYTNMDNLSDTETN